MNLNLKLAIVFLYKFQSKFFKGEEMKTKRKWENPKITELEVQKKTRNTTITSNTSDGGAAYTVS